MKLSEATGWYWRVLGTVAQISVGAPITLSKIVAALKPDKDP